MRQHILRIVVAIALLACAGAAVGQQRSAAWLMGILRDQALAHATQARADHHDNDAATWQGWAKLYDKLTGDSRLQQTDAASFARNNAKFNQEEALVMTRNGIGPGADLYNGSAQMWTDLARQLDRGAGTPQAHFPEKQMLTPIGGLAGTPWQNQGGHHASDCRILAQRAQACRTQLAQFQHHNLITGQTNGVYEVMRLQQCDAAQELYIGQCQQ